MHIHDVTDKTIYLAFSCEGEIGVDELVGVLRFVHTTCQEKGRTAALLDLTAVSGTMNGLDRFKVAMRVVPNWDRSIRIAVAMRPDQTIPGHVGQLFAQNRGRRARVFTTLQTAVAWLVGTAEPTEPDRD